MSNIIKPPNKLPPKAIQKAPTYNNYSVRVNIDETYNGDIFSKFASSKYRQINELLNNNFNYNFRTANNQNLAFAILENPDGEMTEYQRLSIIKRLEDNKLELIEFS